ncbi:hypothetical protein CEXT_277501 [Caerostris extrusa]|uniref:Uncharacterized protein n=1 Tax=Caerostris extrusa TaxID=172846 RepID=A0AAV4SIX6_CAEEX|nr:hypothetical protein CEXT_277501 [Caerostris extrusa]
MRGQMFMIPSLSSSSSSERGVVEMESLILLWLASKHRIGKGGGSDWKRKEMEGDGNLRTEGWDVLQRQESHHAPGLPKLVLALPDAVGSIISLPCLLTVA